MTMHRTAHNFDDVVSDASDKAVEAANAAFDMADTMAGRLKEAIQRRPVATVAVAVGLGLLLGATWRR
jgi:ElaB/YqjD/DUF883 family membrane-anchored ribosome-binding protein